MIMERKCRLILFWITVFVFILLPYIRPAEAYSNTLMIPQSVTTIEEEAFYGDTNIDEISLPNGIISIKDKAFALSSASRVYFPTSIEYIADDAFDETNMVGVGFPGIYAQTWCEDHGFEYIPYSTPVDDFTWTIKNDTVTIMKYTGTDAIVVVPSEINTLPVTVLGSSAFSRNKSVEKVYLPSSLSKIDSYAFSNCSALTDISIPDSVMEIGGSAFENCTSLTTFHYPLSLTTASSGIFRGCSGLKQIEIPEGVVTLPSFAFSNAKYIEGVQLPQTLIDIGSYSFSGCTSLSAITIPENVKKIGDNAFDGCIALSEIVFPDSVEEIGYSALQNCSALTEFHYPLSLKTAYPGILRGCTGIKQIVVQEGVTALPTHVFSRATSLERVQLPQSLVQIGSYAFNECGILSEITIPDGVVSIGDHAFDSCSSLTEIAFPDSVESIGSSALKNCTGLTEFHYPLSLKEAGGGSIFYGCSGITEIIVPDGITEIPASLFSHSNYLERIHLPETITKIEIYSFYDCPVLTSLNIPDSVEEMGPRAFEDCIALTQIHYPLSLKTTGGGGNYRGCRNLKEITVPEGVTKLPASAFARADYLEKVNLPSTLEEIDMFAFSGCSVLTDVNIPESVVKIDSWAFEECALLEKIYIGYNVTTIGNYVFNKCTALTVWCEYASTILQYCKNNSVPYYYLTPDGVNSPSGTLYKGDSYGLHGYARASIPLTNVTATIWNSDKSAALQTISVDPSTTDYCLTDEINYHLIFGTLPLGTYHYTLQASTELSEELWADTTFRIVPPPLRIYISNLSLPYGLDSTDYSIGGTIVSNYTITQVKVIVYRPDSDNTVKNITVSPNTNTYNLASLNSQLSLASYANETLSIKIIATSNGETRTLKDTDLSLRTSANIVLNEHKNQTLIDFASDSANRSIFTTEYVDAVIDDMSWVESGIMFVDNVLSISIFERLENLLIYGGNRQDLIELYKKEIVQLIEDGAYEQFNIAGTASKYSKDLLSVLKTEGKLTKEAFKDFKNVKMENYVGSVNKLIGAVKSGISTAKDLEEVYETIATICGNFEAGLYILEYIGSSANISSQSEFNEALNILRTEYVSSKAAIIYEHMKIIQDLILEYGEDQVKDALTDLLADKFGLDFSIAMPKLFAKLTMKAIGLDDVASTYKKLFIRQDLLNIANASYKQAFDRVHNGDHSDAALLELATAISITKAAWVRANDLITKLPRYAYTVGNEYLDYRYNGRISVLLTSSDFD